MFEKFTTSRKVLAGLSAALALMLTLGATAWYGAGRVEAQVRALADREFPAYRAIATMHDVQTATDGALAALVHTGLEPSARQRQLGELKASLAAMQSARRELDAMSRVGERARLWMRAQGPLDAWLGAVGEVQRRLEERDATGAGARPDELVERSARVWRAWTASQQSVPAVNEALDALELESQATVKAAREEAISAMSSAGASLIAVLVLGAGALAAVAFFTSRGLARVVGGLAAEAKRLTDAVDRGEIAVRADPAAVAFEFRPVVAGMNRTMDAFVRPIRMNDAIARKFGDGEVPDLVTDEYRGEFEALKGSWNAVVESTRMRADDLGALMQAALDGRLDVRADASRYRGHNGKLVASMNAILDAVAAPLKEATSVLERLAARDLTARMTGTYPGEYARIQQALNATAESLHRTMAQVAGSTAQVTGAATQIAASSQDVAAGASEQASSLEETSAQLETMTGMVKGSAENAQQASALAQTARAAASQGAEAMGEMGHAMQKIRESAEGTSQIIKEVNEIAFQTNLLALNAAVEAARAGAAGRGFAVVAEEVRSLAQRSKEAANKTEALIQQSVRQAGEGDATAKLVGRKLGEIAAVVGKVTDIVAEIAAAAKEQASGIDQLAGAMTQMNKVTQQNAASSEQSSAAAVALSSQAEELGSIVAGFQLAAALAQPQVRPATGARRVAGKLAARAIAAPARKQVAVGRKASARTDGKPNGIEAYALRPEDVIPLQSDDGFKDF